MSLRVRHLGLLLLALVVVATTGKAQAVEMEKTLLDFEGGPEEGFSVSGSFKAERRPELVKSGTQALRITFVLPEKWPALRLPKDTVGRRGAKRLAIDVHNPQDTPVNLGVRVDDGASKGVEAEVHRSSRRLEPGWNEVVVALPELRTTSASRLLDADDLVSVVFHVTPKETPIDLVFDRLRMKLVTDVGTPEGDARVLREFETAWAQAAGAPAKSGLLSTLRDVDVPRRVRLLDRVLADETAPLVVEDAIRILGRTKADDSVAEALVRTKKAVALHRWRLIEALGRMPSAAARDWLRNAAKDRKAPSDQVAAIRALMRRDGVALLPELEPHKDDPWQVRAAKVEALRTVRSGNAIGGLIPFLKDGNARIRDEANDALVGLAGRDLGEDVGAWTRWWEANRGTFDPDAKGPKAGRSPYGASSFYGIPVLPGRIAFAIDLSGSMKESLTPGAKAYAAKAPHLKEKRLETRLDLAKEELQNTLAKLPPRTSIQLLFFGTQITAWKNGKIIDADEETRADAQKRVRALAAEGSTNIHGALLRAFSPDPDWTFAENLASGVDTIFLLTDGEPSTGAIVNAGELLADIRDRNRVRRLRIHTIGVGLPNSNFLRTLARDSGGIYVDLAKP